MKQEHKISGGLSKQQIDDVIRTILPRALTRTYNYNGESCFLMPESPPTFNNSGPLHLGS